ncbi:hypothetical protein CFP56_011050 [Quercus suber]|uniref:Uncharacterized protein n=1 Tax=Quercus suber TaxID=58331 RepID=A0AAW0KYH0_QUESU
MANDKDAMRLKGSKRNIDSKDGHDCPCGKKIQGLPELRDHQRKCKAYKEMLNYLTKGNILAMSLREYRPSIWECDHLCRGSVVEQEQGDRRRPTCRQ